jgi:hypothetical protein
VKGCKVIRGGDRKKTAPVCPKDQRLTFFKLCINIQFPSTRRRDSVSIQQHKPVNSVGEKSVCAKRKSRYTQNTLCGKMSSSM